MIHSTITQNEYTILMQSLNQNIHHNLSVRIDSLICDHVDTLRNLIFKSVSDFYEYAKNEENYIWANNDLRIMIEEFIEYYERDRNMMIDELIQTELGVIHEKNELNELFNIVEDIENLDNRYLQSLIEIRNIFNDYV